MKIKTIKSDILLIITATIWGATFVAQRIGMEYIGPFTYNAIRFALGTLTGLYVIFVPIMGIFIGQKPGIGTWVGSLLAAVGLYLLCITDDFTIAYGDFLEVMGTFFWAGHVLIIFKLSKIINPVFLSFMQFITCSILSFIVAFCFETITISSINGALIPILYGGICSVGIAYTLQVVAQKDAHPAHAAILLSLESVIAAVGGWIILNEVLSLRGLAGCFFMLTGMLVSQLQMYLFPKNFQNYKRSRTNSEIIK
ncbi:MAG: hypothetical protein B6I31_01840 [Desulfobacteraceae bacterium 4572_19]|nr:MAG: hypothetical protein B6I31_01840 [Desulfobacteraceae bacterium 4572_19]